MPWSWVPTIDILSRLDDIIERLDRMGPLLAEIVNELRAIRQGQR